MGTKNNPNPNDCYTKAEPDEPMFTLLGRDPVAAFVIRCWVSLRRLVCGDEPALFEEALSCAKACEDWAKKLGKGDRIEKAHDVSRKWSEALLALEFPVDPGRVRNSVQDFRPGIYRHYKGSLYRALCLARDHETQAPLVVYVPLSPHGDSKLPSPPQVRPLCTPGQDSWTDRVGYPGSVPRFEWVGP